ncbi:MAG: hypothetical protein RL095_39 [Verrucomicrobiota bacterium]|jgi:hypothetical protein
MTIDDTKLLATINSDLSKLGKCLRGFNYEVAIHVWAVTDIEGMKPMEIIAKGLGAKVSGICKGPRSIDKLFKSIRFALRHRGNESWGYQTNDLFVASPEFDKQLDDSIQNCSQLFKNSRCRPFYLRDGHPFYPVFWSFAYLIEKGSDGYLFIASGSD